MNGSGGAVTRGSNTEFQEENPVCVRKGDDSFEKERESATKPRRQGTGALGCSSSHLGTCMFIPWRLGLWCAGT